MNKNYSSTIALISEIKENANRFIVNRLKEVGVEGLVASHGSILVLLYKKGPCRMNDIAKAIKRKKNTVTTLITKLVNYGYVEVLADPSDSRVKVVTLTAKGMDIKADFFGIAEELIEKTYAGIEEDRREEFAAVLSKIRDNLA